MMVSAISGTSNGWVASSTHDEQGEPAAFLQSLKSKQWTGIVLNMEVVPHKIGRRCLVPPQRNQQEN